MRRTAIVGLLALVSWSAQAEHAVPGWRAGAAASFADFEGESDLGAPLSELDDSAVGLKLHTQYQFNDWFGIEGAYFNTADFEEQTGTGDIDLNLDGFSIDGVAYIPMGTPDIKLYGKAGYFDADSEVSLNGAVDNQGSEDGLTLGAGAMIEIAEQWGIRADFDWYDADVGDLWMVNLGLEYFFGGEKKAEPPPPPPPPPPPEPEPEPAPPPPPADTDGDGVADTGDACPDTPAGERVGEKGCSCDVTRQVEFAFNSAELTPEGEATLDEVAETLQRLNWVGGTVEGHTDNVGGDEFNMDLSQRRAQTVADYLEDKGVSPGRFDTQGFGESQPVADNETEEGRAQNRRVVLRRTDCGPAP
jgi:OOP family OmpA-OmpF porin